MQKITIYNVIQPLIEGTKDFGKLRVDDYVNDFKAELQKHLLEYDVNFILVDDDEWSLIPDFSNATTDEEIKQIIDDHLTYPMIVGNISDEEEERIINMLYEDPFVTFHADGDYFDSI